jgi:cytochrome P450
VAVRLERELQALVNDKPPQRDGPPSVLDVMLQARAAGMMDDEELIGQTITIFNAAYHTTTYALTWAQFLLAQHPSVMRRLDAELQTLPADGPPGVDEVMRLPLLDRVIKESLRLLPSVVYLPRIAAERTTLGPHKLPAGTMIVASPYMSHHLPDVFPEPERFLPDRWATSPAPWGYIPFGAGARLCLGAPLATLIIKLTMHQVFRRFRLQVQPGANIERHGTLSLGAKHGVPVVLHAADGAFTASPVVGSIHEMVDLVEVPEALKRVA